MQLTEEDLRGKRLKDWAYQDTLMEDVRLEFEMDHYMTTAEQASLAKRSSGQLYDIYALYLAVRREKGAFSVKKGDFIVDWEDKKGSEVLCFW